MVHLIDVFALQESPDGLSLLEKQTRDAAHFFNILKRVSWLKSSGAQGGLVRETQLASRKLRVDFSK